MKSLEKHFKYIFCYEWNESKYVILNKYKGKNEIIIKLYRAININHIVLICVDKFSVCAETWVEKGNSRREHRRFIVPRTVVVADRDYFMCNLNIRRHSTFCGTKKLNKYARIEEMCFIAARTHIHYSHDNLILPLWFTRLTFSHFT